VFDNLSAWTWVAIAWGQLVLAYVIYLLYMRQLERRIRDGADGT
jgi:hypothetical protein